MTGSRRLASFAVIVAGSAVFLLIGCATKAEETADDQLTRQVSLDGRTQLLGGDSRAWLSSRGNVGDAGYCAARLKLPLEREPAWTAEYTAAEFSARYPMQIVHYDGVLAVSAESPQILGLDPVTGRRIFNKDLYTEERPGDASFKALFFHPAGLLTSQDNVGRFYCWDFIDGEPQQLWISKKAETNTGFIPFGDYLVCGGLQDVLALDFATGKAAWRYPVLLGTRGIVAAADGTNIWWSDRQGDVVALDSGGALLWKLSQPDMIISVHIDDRMRRAYIVFLSEHMQCCDLHTGEILWDYDWSWLIPPEEREQRIEQVRFNQIYIVAFWPAIMPDGICLPMTSGDVICLDPDGVLRWHYEAQTAIKWGLGFENGIMVEEFYGDPRKFDKITEAPFNLEPPDWEGYTAEAAAYEKAKASAEAAGEEAPSRLIAFSRFVVLNASSGDVLDVFEPAIVPGNQPIPVYDKIVFGEKDLDEVYRRYKGREPSRVQAYNWLERRSE